MALQPLSTGQHNCYDEIGREVPCAGSGQDAEFARGAPWPEPRFEQAGESVRDLLTGLYWLRDAGAAGFPLDWRESLDFVSAMNRERAGGKGDWRLPNRRELRSIISHGTARPSLPLGHPFINTQQTWYWTSTTAAINKAYAWYVNLEGGRMFYGAKSQYFMLWPVRGEAGGLLPVTGQQGCYDLQGSVVPCEGTGQDGEFGHGCGWPQPRFRLNGSSVTDRLTGLVWRSDADLTGTPVTWAGALSAIAKLNRDEGAPGGWRLPNINELESLVDCSRASPALPAGNPFRGLREAYWSSTTSAFESDWAWALYMEKGACGVGRKNGRYFFVWPVKDG